MDDLDRILAAYGSVAEYNRVQDEKDYSYDSLYDDEQDYLDKPDFVWTVITECNDDDGHPTCFSTEYEGRMFWGSHLSNGWAIEIKCSDGEYRPISSDYEGFETFNEVAQFFE
ncbi:MAG: hypothetical protein IJ740_05125, partial [Ruminococcus sp.]|nr:hypothetical protein [Ruminococcus sp.]